MCLHVSTTKAKIRVQCQALIKSALISGAINEKHHEEIDLEFQAKASNSEYLTFMVLV